MKIFSLFSVYFVLFLFAASLEAGDWRELSTEHFHFLSEVSDAETIALARRLERYRFVLGRIFPGFQLDPPPHSHIILFRDWKSFEPYATRGYDGKGNPIGGYMTSRGRGTAHIALNMESVEADRSLIHEYAHMVGHLNLRNLPLWMKEGLAGLLEQSEVESGRLELGGMEPRDWALLQEGPIFSLKQLTEVGSAGVTPLLGDKTKLFYAQSSAFTSYLLLGDQGAHRSKLLLFMHSLNSGVERDAAWRTAFHFPVESLEMGFQKSLRRVSPEVTLISLPSIPRFKLGQISTVEDGEAGAHRAELWLTEGKEVKAIEKFEKMVASGEAGPDVRFLLGLVAMGAKQFRDAEDHFRAGLRLAPDAPNLRYYTVLSFFRGRLRDVLGTGELENMMAESAGLLKPLAEDPRRFPQAYRLMVKIRMRRGDPPKEMIPLLERAKQMFPESSEFDLHLGQLYAREKRWRDARRVFQWMAETTDDDLDRMEAEEWLDYLKVAEALEGSALLSERGSSSSGPAEQRLVALRTNAKGPIEYVRGILAAVDCRDDGMLLTVHFQTSNGDRGEVILFYPLYDPPLVFDRSGSGQRIDCGTAGISVGIHFRRTLEAGKAIGTILTLEPYPMGPQ